jgi:hypothetical protein
MKKTAVLFVISVIVISLPGKLFAFPGSPALVSMMEQCEKTYLLPQNTNFNELSTRHSLVNVAMVLGFGMQIQRKNAGTDPHKIKKFEALERDVFAVLDWMVKKKKNIDNNGEKVTFQDLKWAYQKSLQGALNKFSADKYNVQIESVRHKSALQFATNSPVEPVRQSNGSGLNTNPADNRIDLLGVKSGDKIKKSWPKLKKFGPDVIVGNWFSNQSCKEYRGCFEKTKTGYRGQLSSPSDSKFVYDFNVQAIKQDWEVPQKPYYWQITYSGTFRLNDLEPKRLTFTIRPFRDTWMIYWKSKSIGGWSPLHRPL